jgi:hypothetical protein
MSRSAFAVLLASVTTSGKGIGLGLGVGDAVAEAAGLADAAGVAAACALRGPMHDATQVSVIQIRKV